MNWQRQSISLKRCVQYETFIENNSIGIIYIGNDEKANKYLEDCSLEYEYNYLYINQNDITNFKKNKIRERLKLDKKL